MVEDHVITFAKDGNYRIYVRLNVKLIVHSTPTLSTPALVVVPRSSGTGNETVAKDRRRI